MKLTPGVSLVPVVDVVPTDINDFKINFLHHQTLHQNKLECS
jgi:hypothetical protein